MCLHISLGKMEKLWLSPARDEGHSSVRPGLGRTKLSWRFEAAANPKPQRALAETRETQKLAESEMVPLFSF